jgi:hypothetical protein
VRNRNTPKRPAPEISTDRYDPPAVAVEHDPQGEQWMSSSALDRHDTVRRITPAISDPSVSMSVQPRGSACEKP